MLDKMAVEEAGGEVFFGTTITDVITEGRTIKAVIIDSINGLEAVKAKYYIDCTGDGQLGFKAGASYVVGNEEGYSSSPTLMFRMANVDIDRLISEMEAHRDTLGLSVHQTYTRHQMTPWQNRKAIKRIPVCSPSGKLK
jgi:flavin-dependent dehydrogenase